MGNNYLDNTICMYYGTQDGSPRGKERAMKSGDSEYDAPQN